MKGIIRLRWILLPLLCAAGFILWVFLPYSNPYVIELASPPPTSSAPPRSDSPLNEEIELTPDNVQAVIETLSRPESYHLPYVVSRNWQGGSSMTNITLTVDESSININGTVYDRNGLALTEQDAIANIPTYEEVLKLDRSDIIDASYKEHNGSPYIYVEFTGLMYVHEYYISIDNGLLDYARIRDGDVLVYSMEPAR